MNILLLDILRVQQQEPSAAELEKMFVGTTVSWYQVVGMVDEANRIDKAKTEDNIRSSEIWNEEVHK